MAEHSAVNRRVVGSSPTRGATLQRQDPCEGSFFVYNQKATAMIDTRKIIMNHNQKISTNSNLYKAIIN